MRLLRRLLTAFVLVCCAYLVLADPFSRPAAEESGCTYVGEQCSWCKCIRRKCTDKCSTQACNDNCDYWYYECTRNHGCGEPETSQDAL